MEVLDVLAPATSAARPGYKLTPLGWLPAGWEVVRVNDVARMGSGHTPDKKKDAYYNGGIKWVSLQDSHRLDKRYIHETTLEISEAGLRNSSAVLHPANTVVLCRDAGVGKCAIIAEDMAVSQHFIAWRCGPQLHPEFLYYTLLSRREYFEQHANGSTIKTLGLPFFQKLQIALPPLPEQQRIVAVLAAVDETLTAYDNLLHAKRRYQQGLRQQLLTGQRRFPEFAGQAWREVTLGEFLQESREPLQKTSSVHHRITVRLNLKGIEVRDVRGTEAEESTVYYRRRAGQFIYGKQNLHKGAFGIIPAELDGYESTQDVPALDFLPGLNPTYFYYWMAREDFYPALESHATGTGSKRIQPTSLVRLNLLLPSLPEQRRIAAMLTALATELHLLATQRAHWQQQKQGLLQALLTGVVQVKGN